MLHIIATIQGRCRCCGRGRGTLVTQRKTWQTEAAGCVSITAIAIACTLDDHCSVYSLSWCCVVQCCYSSYSCSSSSGCNSCAVLFHFIRFEVGVAVSRPTPTNCSRLRPSRPFWCTCVVATLFLFSYIPILRIYDFTVFRFSPHNIWYFVLGFLALQKLGTCTHIAPINK